MPPRWLVAGVVGRPHGLDGSFHVRDGNPDLLEVGRTVTVGDRPLTIARVAGTDRRPIVRLTGVDRRDGAAALGGERLLAPASDAPALGEDEWYAADLEGCHVGDGEVEVGEVRRLVGLPSCEVLEVARPGREDLLVPLISDAVRSVDVDAKRIDVDLAFLGEAPG